MMRNQKKLREDYVQHVSKMFELAGDAPDRAASEAKTVMTLETTLAKASRTNVELRDPEKNYNKMTLAQMKTLTPTWSWEGYFKNVGAPPVGEANIGQPDFFKELDRQLTATSLPDWKIYLKWHLLHSKPLMLSDDFVQENFNFYGKKLAGTKEITPRWKRCVQQTDHYLGEALGDLCEDVLHGGSQGARQGNGEQPDCGAARRYSDANLDGAGDQEASAGEDGSVHSKNRLSG